jgi:hypothetical protein
VTVQAVSPMETPSSQTVVSVISPTARTSSIGWDFHHSETSIDAGVEET